MINSPTIYFTQVITIESVGKGSTFAKASFSSSGARDDIDINDPEFWQKWAKKADVEIDTGKVRYSDLACTVAC